VQALRADVARVSQRLEAVEQHLGVTPAPPPEAGYGPSAEVIGLLDAGDTAEAVARYVEETGCDMKTAMQMVADQTRKD
jgi:hypothetical protein